MVYVKSAEKEDLTASRVFRCQGVMSTALFVIAFVILFI